MENIQKFLDNPGEHRAHKKYEIMKDTLEFMMKNAVGYDNVISTDRIISYLHSKGHKIGKEQWQISIEGYLRDNKIFIGAVIPKGMFLINSEDDAKKAYASMKKRVKKENARIKILEEMAEQEGYHL